MGMGRNSSRLASRRLASKENYRENANDDEYDEDEDWIEPTSDRRSTHNSALGQSNLPRRKRDKNSPRRTKGRARNGGAESGYNDGTVTPPSSYDSLTMEERSRWLGTICGVLSMTSRKICTRSTRCPVHTDAQRREVRIKWLSSMGDGGTEETHVDIDR